MDALLIHTRNDACVRDVHGCTSVEHSHGWRVRLMFYHLLSVFIQNHLGVVWLSLTGN